MCGFGTIMSASHFNAFNPLCPLFHEMNAHCTTAYFSGSVELGGWVTLAWPLPSSTTRTETLWKNWLSWLWRRTLDKGNMYGGGGRHGWSGPQGFIWNCISNTNIIIWSHYNNKFVVSLSVSFWIFLLEQVPAWFFHSRAVILKAGCVVQKYWSGTAMPKGSL